MDLTIDYCTECGYLDRAVDIAREVLEDHGGEFDRVELVPSDGGVLRVSIDSEVVFDVDEDDYSLEDIRQKVLKHLEEKEEEEG